ncbi:SufD family Fe-S cluster assembly protein [Corynebacterium sp.]|uniref:SufD family Fe-S cluster assembly protein n=1 Tax=Corynebacterium sp. TaxID=1720 RepID=UPI002A910145|nr:SufD family Fe-S cluster assembly protein [Corynebacterium sp.]MDY5785415.1 SufD family Fe-S cluster assembly protein [Corynebacterium sp.]
MSTPKTIHTSLAPQNATATADLDRCAVSTDILEPVGWAPEESRAATSILVDHGFSALSSSDDDIVVMPLSRALLEFPWVQELMFSLISPDEDDMLHRAFESSREPLGTFTWVRDGATVTLPVQSFTVMTVPQERQFTHDITVIGKGAVVDHVSGSAVTPTLSHGTHVSVCETFIGDGAQVRSVDVDKWGSEMNVYSYGRTQVGVGASVSSVSVAVSAVHCHRSQSRTELASNASCTSHSIVLAPTGTKRIKSDVVVLAGEGAQAEQVARMVADGGVIENRSQLVAQSSGVNGFLECDGLMLRSDGGITSVPALDAQTDGAQLSHEASVGMIDSEKLDYLMSTGLTEDAARNLIIQGFLDLDDDQIPVAIRERVENLVAAARGAEKM